MLFRIRQNKEVSVSVFDEESIARVGAMGLIVPASLTAMKDLLLYHGVIVPNWQKTHFKWVNEPLLRDCMIHKFMNGMFPGLGGGLIL